MSILSKPPDLRNGEHFPSSEPWSVSNNAPFTSCVATNCPLVSTFVAHEFSRSGHPLTASPIPEHPAYHASAAPTRHTLAASHTHLACMTLPASQDLAGLPDPTNGVTKIPIATFYATTPDFDSPPSPCSIPNTPDSIETTIPSLPCAMLPPAVP